MSLGGDMGIEEELAELSTVYHGQRERLEAIEQLLKEVAQAPVFVEAYAWKELLCMFCTPYEDRRGIAHHSPMCVVERAKDLLGKLA
jgi:hypothetical protein